MEKVGIRGWPAIFLLLTWLPAIDAGADGGFFQKSVAVSADQRAIIIKNGEEISMTLSTGYTGEGEDFGWIIPTPVPPGTDQVREAGAGGEAAFEMLDRYSAPVFSRGGGCFPVGTKVVTADGPRAIETVEPGARAYAFDLSSGTWILTRVLQRHSLRYQGDMVSVHIDSLTIQSTGNHPFYVMRGEGLSSRPLPRDVPTSEQGMTARGRWVEARDLKPGDILLNKTGNAPIITGVSSRQENVEVYNLTVEGYHSYAVHESGILVHNKGGTEEEAPSGAVKVHGRVALEHYEASILSAASASALLDWLRENGYRASSEARKVLEAYIAKDWAFVAVKLNPAEKRHYENELLPPLTIMYQHDGLIFPLRISSVSTTQTARITLYVVAESTVSSTNVPTVRLQYRHYIPEYEDPERYIEGCIERTTGADGRRLAVTWCGQFDAAATDAGILSELMRAPFPDTRKAYLTRLEARMGPEAMTEDIHLTLDQHPLGFQVSLRPRRSSGFTDGIASAARFYSPLGIATDGTNLYVTDSFNHVIRKIVIATGAVSTIAGSAGVAGSTDGAGNAASFYYPGGIATDGMNLYVMDDASIGKVRKVTTDPAGVVTTVCNLQGPVGHVVPGGTCIHATNLYFADTRNSVIRKIAIATGTVTTIAGSEGKTGFADGIGSAALLNHPRGIATDGTNLYVTDSDNQVIRKIEISTGEVMTIAGTAGKKGFADGTGSAACFNLPTGITTDGTKLYVTDCASHTIREIAISTSAVTTIAGAPGQTGTSDGIGRAAHFSYPWGITTNGTNLYVADSGNHTIRKIAIATGAVSTLAGSAWP